MNNEEQNVVVEEQNKEVTTEIKSPNKNSNGSYKAVIVLLLLVILGGAVYFCYDKGIIFNKKDSSETKEEKKKENKKEKNSVRELTAEEKDKFKERIVTVTNNFDMSFPIEDVTKISNQELLSFASTMIMTSGERKTEFSSEEVEKVLTKYFGTNVKVTHENILCSLDKVPFYDYDSQNKKYTFHENHPGHGGNGSVQGYYYFVDGKVTDEKKIVINSHIIYGIYKGDTWGPQNSYYKSAKESQNGEPIIGKRDSDENIELTDELYNSVKDKLPTTTYTFEKDKDGNYNLVSIQVK